MCPLIDLSIKIWFVYLLYFDVSLFNYGIFAGVSVQNVNTCSNISKS